jgi:hypothetical protein
LPDARQAARKWLQDQAARNVAAWKEVAASTVHPSAPPGPPDPSAAALDLDAAGWAVYEFVRAVESVPFTPLEAIAEHGREVAAVAPALVAEVRRLRAAVEEVRAERNIAVNAAAARTPGFDVVAVRIACDQREAADRRAGALQAVVARVEALVEHARKVSPSESMNVAVADIEVALRGTA